MISLGKVQIENFQSHEDTLLDFSNGFNVITGPSDQGKSAVLRAIKWALYNEPRGTEFIREGAKQARVTIVLNNKYSIIRERSSSKNRYVVIDPDKNELVLEGFGNEVPAEVSEAHGIPRVILDTNLSESLNMAEQLEGPFLISRTGAIRAKAIGRLIGLHVIDKAIRNCNSDLRKEVQTKDEIQDVIQDIENRLQGIQDIEALEKTIIKNEDLIHRIDDLIMRREELEKYRVKTETLNRQIQLDEETIKSLDHISACEFYIRDAASAVREHLLLNNLKEKMLFVSEEADKYEEVLRLTQKLELASESLKDLDNRLEVFMKLKGLNSKYSSLQMQIHQQETELKSSEGNMADLTKKLFALLKELKVCPVCGSNIDLLKLHSIIDHYREAH